MAKAKHKETKGLTTREEAGEFGSNSLGSRNLGSNSFQASTSLESKEEEASERHYLLELSSRSSTKRMSQSSRPPSPPPPSHHHSNDDDKSRRDDDFHEHHPPPPPPPSDFLAWCWHRTFGDCCTFRRPPHLQGQPVKVGAFIPVFLLKLLLEVLGAAGAVWGCSEVLTLRNANNSELWRGLSLITCAVFLVRLYWHSKHWLEHEHDFPYVKLHHRRQHVIVFCQVFSAKLILQVAGAAGAIWGCSEALGIRVSSNNSAWRLAAQLTGLLFLLRWMVEVLSYCLVIGGNPETTAREFPRRRFRRREKTNPVRLVVKKLEHYVLPWTEFLVVKFILEVCGAVGAVWGFTEIVFLRRSDDATSMLIWRIVSLVVGGILLTRWLLQAYRLCFESDHTAAPLVTEPMPLKRQREERHLNYVPSPVKQRQSTAGNNDGNSMDQQDIETPASLSDEEAVGVGDDGLVPVALDDLALVNESAHHHDDDGGEAKSYQHEQPQQPQTLAAVSTNSTMDETCSPPK